jgi:hypothetical protein
VKPSAWAAAVRSGMFHTPAYLATGEMTYSHTGPKNTSVEFIGYHAMLPGIQEEKKINCVLVRNGKKKDGKDLKNNNK